MTSVVLSVFEVSLDRHYDATVFESYEGNPDMPVICQ